MLPLQTHELKEIALLASLPRPPKRSKPGKGKVRLNDNSSIRKLMRAARRGMVQEERARVIVGAMMTSERGKAHRWQRVEGGCVDNFARPDLTALLQRSVAAFNALTPEQQREHTTVQRKSWVVGEMCLEHPDMTRDEARAIYDRVVL